MLIARSRIPARLVLGLTLAIILDTAVQLLWKTAIAGVPPGTSMTRIAAVLLQQPLFIIVGALMIAQLVNWLKVLANTDLSYAKPITSLSYVTVSVGSVILLGESIHPAQVAGILMVISGVWLVSRGGHAVAQPEPANR